MIHKDKIRKVAEFGQTYIDKFLQYDKSLLTSDWWYALEFFFDRSFYQGRRDELSKKFEKAALKALTEHLGATLGQKETTLLRLKKAGWLDNYDAWVNIENPLQKVLLRHSVNKKGDRLMVINALGFINDLKDLNIVNYTIAKTKRGQLQEVHKGLLSMWSVGDKIASFFLRDLACIFESEAELTPSDYIFLQPVDTWVRQVSQKLGFSVDSYSDSKLKEVIVDYCLRGDVSPIRFNQGAWFVGANAFDVLFELL